mmetsp:Transcript_4157/g.8832  ORF Transcript_4157/g.8832 Transcript_4157/m.8832 type:complete len:343 (-) Transcript_4157:1340-2368(-)
MGRSRRRRRRPVHPHVHRPPPRPRGHESPGVRGTPTREPQRPPSGLHSDHGRPQRPHHRPLGPPRRGELHRGDGQSHPGAPDAAEREGLRAEVLRDGGRAAGNRAHHRAGAGLHAPGVHVRVRRLAHGDARRVRGAGVRDRDERGGARAGDADPLPDQGQEHAHPDRRVTRRRRDLQGHHPPRLRRHRHGRRDRGHHRVCWTGCRGALHGSAHVHLQHGHRGRRARWHHRPRRRHLRVPQGTSHEPRGGGLGQGGGVLEEPQDRRGRRLRRDGHHRRQGHRPHRHVGYVAPGRHAGHGQRPQDRRGGARRGAKGRRRPFVGVHRTRGRRPHRGDAGPEGVHW